MLRSERHQSILKKLTTVDAVSTVMLAKEFGQSAETLRTDLIFLDKAGKLERVRGGARSLNRHRYGLPLPERTSLNQLEKSLIAKRACSLIHHRDTVFLDASSTVLTMTDYFPNIEATVLTNANHVVVAFGEQQNIDVICTGGEYEQRSRSYVGIIAEEATQRYHLQWLFIGVDGIDETRGLSEINPGQAHLKERIIPVADKVCVLADHTKLNRKSAFFFARPSQIDFLITDSQADPDFLQRMEKKGVTVIIC
jgi:DeoR/GlpR family transcriptional regulator of sugar metabolism